MEMDLQHIIDKIKEEGVGEAEKTASGIIERAKKEEKAIIDGAETEKDDIIDKARQEADRLKKNGEEAIRQASRDVLLALRERILALFDKVMKKEVTKQLSTDVLKDMIVRLVENFREKGEIEVEVLLSKKDKTDLEQVLFKHLKGEIAKGVTLKVSPGIEKGFRIGEKDKNAYYDFTDDAIAEAFKTFLNPKVTEILNSEKKDA